MTAPERAPVDDFNADTQLLHLVPTRYVATVSAIGLLSSASEYGVIGLARVPVNDGLHDAPTMRIPVLGAQ